MAPSWRPVNMWKHPFYPLPYCNNPLVRGWPDQSPNALVQPRQVSHQGQVGAKTAP